MVKVLIRRYRKKYNNGRIEVHFIYRDSVTEEISKEVRTIMADTPHIPVFSTTTKPYFSGTQDLKVGDPVVVGLGNDKEPELVMTSGIWQQIKEGEEKKMCDERIKKCSVCGEEVSRSIMEDRIEFCELHYHMYMVQRIKKEKAEKEAIIKSLKEAE